jgi:hypothetical protein
MNQEKTFENFFEDFFLDIFDKEAEVFPKAFFPKNFPKIQKLPDPFRSVQSSINERICVHRTFLYHDNLFLERIEILLHYFHDVFLALPQK